MSESKSLFGDCHEMALKNAIWSILLKYQKIDLQIQAFTEEN